VRRREINLYFASVSPGDAAFLVSRWFGAAIAGGRQWRPRFERAVAESLGAPVVRLFGSARGALAACLRAVRLAPGDEVIVAGFTCLAVPTAVVAAGATPVYADIDPQSLLTPLERVLEKVSRRTKAVILQHTFGNVVEPSMVTELRGRGLIVIEDCALAAGSAGHTAQAGASADAAVFSLELSKTISTGWGGILVARHGRLAENLTADYEGVAEPSPARVARMVWQTALSGILYRPAVYPAGKYLIALLFKLGIFRPSTGADEIDGRVPPDFVVRLSPAQAALGERMWRRLDGWRRDNAKLVERLRNVIRARGLQPVAEGAPGLSVCNRVPFLIRDRRSAIEWFAASGIELGAWFDAPVSPMPPSGSPVPRPECPAAAFVSQHIVNLPAHQRITEADVRAIERVLTAYVAAHPDAAAIPAHGGQAT